MTTMDIKNRHSSKRRSAALKLRKLKDPSCGPALLSALIEELKDPRTWVIQYQMIMALGHSGYTEAIPLLEILAHEKFEATTVLAAVGDAYVRLSRKSNEDATPVLKMLRVQNDGQLRDGALRAVAMLRMHFNAEDTSAIIHMVQEERSEERKFWLIAACPGWSGVEVDEFIDQCMSSPRDDVRKLAADAKIKKYRKWRPL
jgi:hypothetical protein